MYSDPLNPIQTIDKKQILSEQMMRLECDNWILRDTDMRTNVSLCNYMWAAKYYRDLPILGLNDVNEKIRIFANACFE